ncbi:osmoprotectant transport system permease protein [Rhodoligotrophos appendicifer]|uniref:ABC transporter permease n=1 Tax=Rhodoligotrophos appendicifer TaxID=987056 RepID=UPI001184E5BB|nr:ABC transporter permease [Rhodoligotrophos appendicifer]
MNFLIANPGTILNLGLQHLSVSLGAVLIAVLIGLPLGIAAAKIRWLELPALTLAGLLYLVPSLALFAFLIPILGLGTLTAVVGLSIYSLLVIMRNVAIGLSAVPEPLLEAARGIGMTRSQSFRLVEFPLSVPMIIAGIRIATVMTVGVASLAAYIGAGGFGVLIFRGIATADNDMIIAGALPTAALALACDWLLRQAERLARAEPVP